MVATIEDIAFHYLIPWHTSSKFGITSFPYHYKGLPNTPRKGQQKQKKKLSGDKTTSYIRFFPVALLFNYSCDHRLHEH